MKRRIIFTVLLLGWLTIGGFSQTSTTLSLSLDQAREYALEHNRVLKNAQYDVAISKKQIWANIAQGLPQAEGSIDYTDFFNYEVELNFGGGGGTPDIDFTKLDAGDLEILSLLNQMMGSGTSTIKMDNSSSAKFQVSQLVFSGQYLVGLKIAKIAHHLTELALESTEADIIEAVTSSYYIALVTIESSKTLDASIENLNKTLAQTKVMLAAGMAEQVDVDQLELAVMMLQNTKSQMQRAVEMSYNLIRFQLGVDANTEIVLTESLDDIIGQINFQALAGDSFVLENNPTYKMLLTQEEMTGKMMQLEKWNYAPTIVGFYSYNEKLITTDFDMNPKHIAGVTMTIPIFSSGMRNAKVQQKKIEFEKSKNTRLMVQDQLLMQEKQYRFDLINAIEQYELQKRGIDVAKRIYDNTEVKYTHGVASSLQLTQASDNYLKAQNNYISALMNLLQAKNNFDKLLNNL
ncbi:MAG TPA: TolC family protein [Bacteroidales bacterium]|mgnify:FL=1|nr:TolC family protein [Bacteroidales bacterium]